MGEHEELTAVEKLAMLEAAVRDIERTMRAVFDAPAGGELAASQDAAAALSHAIELLSPDAPIAAPVDRAEAVAQELRRRGIWANVCYVGFIALRIRDGARYRVVDIPYRIDAGPRAIADAIQREEAEMAKRWAGGGHHGE